MSRANATRSSVTACFPRVSGDEPAVSAAADLEQSFSPRERG